MDNTARITGYSFALVVLMASLILVASLRTEWEHRHHLVSVWFPETGSLMVEDPVTRLGVTVGKVREVRQGDKGAIVLLELNHRNPIPSDSRFVNFNHSLMGARQVVLVPGHSQVPLNEKEVVIGLFANGVAETLHRVGDLLSIVVHYDSLSTVWRRPANQPGSWQGVLEGSLYNAFDQMTVLEQKLETLQRKTEGNLHQIELQTTWVSEQAEALAPATQAMINSSTDLLVHLDELSTEGEKLTVEVDSLLQLIQRPNSSFRPILMERQLYDRIVQLTRVMDGMIQILTSDGLDAIHWHNVHFHWKKKSGAKVKYP